MSKDKNQQSIVEDIESVPGMSVIEDMDDIAVGFRGVTLLVEIKGKYCLKKSGDISESRKQKSQKKLDETFTGARIYATCSDDIFRWFGIIK